MSIRLFGLATISSRGGPRSSAPVERLYTDVRLHASVLETQRRALRRKGEETRTGCLSEHPSCGGSHKNSLLIRPTLQAVNEELTSQPLTPALWLLRPLLFECRVPSCPRVRIAEGNEAAALATGESTLAQSTSIQHRPTKIIRSTVGYDYRTPLLHIVWWIYFVRLYAHKLVRISGRRSIPPSLVPLTALSPRLP